MQKYDLHVTIWIIIRKYKAQVCLNTILQVFFFTKLYTSQLNMNCVHVHIIIPFKFFKLLWIRFFDEMYELLWVYLICFCVWNIFKFAFRSVEKWIYSLCKGIFSLANIKTHEIKLIKKEKKEVLLICNH